LETGAGAPRSRLISLRDNPLLEQIGRAGDPLAVRDPARNEPMIVVARETDAYRAFWTIDGVFQGRGARATQVG
jgi:hypothetical protein